MSNLAELNSVISNVSINWHIGYGNKPDLYVDFNQHGSEDAVWDFVKSDTGYFLKAEVMPGVWKFCHANEDGNEGMFIGSGGAEMTFVLTNGDIFVSSDVWSSNSNAINEVFGLEGMDRLREVGCLGYNIVWGDYAFLVEWLGYKAVCTDKYIYPSTSIRCIEKFGAIADSHVKLYFSSMSPLERVAFFKSRG